MLAEGIYSTFVHSFILRGLNTEGIESKCGISSVTDAFARDVLGFFWFFFLELDELLTSKCFVLSSGLQMFLGCRDDSKAVTGL